MLCFHKKNFNDNLAYMFFKTFPVIHHHWAHPICLSITASLFVTGSVCPFILWHLNLDSVRAGPHLSQNLPHLSKERVLARQQ